MIANCIAPSLAAFVVGCVVGGTVAVLTASAAMWLIHSEFAKEETRRLIKIESAAVDLYDDERIQGYFENENAPDDSPPEYYEIPADVWEKFEKVIEKHVDDDEEEDEDA